MCNISMEILNISTIIESNVVHHDQIDDDIEVKTLRLEPVVHKVLLYLGIQDYKM